MSRLDSWKAEREELYRYMAHPKFEEISSMLIRNEGSAHIDTIKYIIDLVG